MIAALALLAAAQTAALDWEALPALPLRAPPIVTPEMQDFVTAEAKRGKCVVPPAGLRVDVAVLVTAEGGIRTAVPRAINCPGVEQYAAALVAGYARGNLLPRMGAGEQWYRTSIAFRP